MSFKLSSIYYLLEVEINFLINDFQLLFYVYFREHELWFDDVEDIFIEKPVQEDHTGIDENGSTDVLIKPGTKAV